MLKVELFIFGTWQLNEHLVLAWCSIDSRYLSEMARNEYQINITWNILQHLWINHYPFVKSIYLSSNRKVNKVPKTRFSSHHVSRCSFKESNYPVAVITKIGIWWTIRVNILKNHHVNINMTHQFISSKSNLNSWELI